ncbi:MAG: UvrD-helicase domain-containing protein [Thermoanaerobaculia bacterium]
MSGKPDPRTLDQEARRAAQTVFDRPVIVEAGAGTGKTTILVARVLSWVLGPGWDAARAEIIDYERARSRQVSTRDEPEEPTPEAVAAKALESVVAITFTEAAAAEMASRVAERLAEVATGKVEAPGFASDLLVDGSGKALEPTTLSTRARSLLGQLDRLTASTIHAFCHALLRRHPLEARLHPDFAIDARGERLEEIVRAVVETRVKQAYAEEEVAESALLELAAYGKSPQQVAEALTEFAFEGVPAAGLEADPFDAEVIGGIASGLRDTVAGFLDLTAGDLTSIKRTQNPARVERALQDTADLLAAAAAGGARGLELADRICQGLGRIWDGAPWTHLKKWSKARFGKAESQTFGDRQSKLAELAAALTRRIAYLRKSKPAFLDVARRALLPLLQEIEREARSTGVINFQALLRETWSLLHDHPRILERERRGIRQLLVDEFQDTDRLQCDIVELLALSETASGSQSGGNGPRPMGLFIVGDPKQSIYGWRNADLEAYDRLVDLALEAGGERFPLVRNFRSAAEILQEVERAVSPVMKEKAGLQPPFQSLVASADRNVTETDGEGPWSPVEYWVSWHPDWSGKTRHGDAAEIEAEAIAADIRALHQAGTRWKDCALLLRSASRVDTYLEGFRNAGVPFVVTSDKQYFRRREVIDASALVRCVVSPADHVALLTWLRSPIVGVPDAALIPLWSREFPKLLTELQGPDQSEALAHLESVIRDSAEDLCRVDAARLPGLDRIKGWEHLLVRSVHALAELRAAFRERPADRFLEQLRWTFLSEAIEGARYLGRYRVANLDRLFRSIQTGLEERGGDVQAVLRLLRRSVGMALEAEEALPKDAAEDAVQVMTIHKAKGLEFGHVYLAQLHAEGRSSERRPFDADRRWNGFGQLEYVLFDEPTLGFDAVERHREQVSAAEQVRTLYVALTRARRRLVLVGNWPDKNKPGWGSQPTYVELLSHRQDHPESIATLATAAGLLDEGVLDAAGVRWKFPGLRRTETEPRPQRPAEELPTPGEVETASERLGALRVEAADRMDRPFLATTSLGEQDHQLAGHAKPSPFDRSTAMAVGKTLHHILETWDFSADLETEYRHRQARARPYFDNLVTGLDHDAGWKEVEELLTRLRESALLERLVGAPETVVARELPILLPPDDPSAAVAGITGTVDLVLRDADGHYSVVDYKTDRVESDKEIGTRAEVYGPQLATYARAVAESLDLDHTVAAELWFLWPDRVWNFQ